MTITDTKNIGSYTVASTRTWEIFNSLQVIYEPTHEILALFVLRKFILQIRMRSHPVGLDVWFLVWPFVYFHSSCVRTAKALARLRRCAGSPEPSLVAYALSTIILWAGSYMYFSVINLTDDATFQRCTRSYFWNFHSIFFIWHLIFQNFIWHFIQLCKKTRNNRSMYKPFYLMDFHQTIIILNILYLT